MSIKRELHWRLISLLPRLILKQNRLIKKSLIRTVREVLLNHTTLLLKLPQLHKGIYILRFMWGINII